MENIISIIEQTGFPVFMVIMLGWYIIKYQDKLRDFVIGQVDKVTELIEKNSEETRGVIDSNNKMLAALLEYFRKKDNDNDAKTS